MATKKEREVETSPKTELIVMCEIVGCTQQAYRPSEIRLVIVSDIDPMVTVAVRSCKEHGRILSQQRLELS